jgi:hypothetical protein
LRAAKNAKGKDVYAWANKNLHATIHKEIILEALRADMAAAAAISLHLRTVHTGQRWEEAEQ